MNFLLRCFLRKYINTPVFQQSFCQGCIEKVRDTMTPEKTLENIQLEIRDGIAFLTLNRPKS